MTISVRTATLNGRLANASPQDRLTATGFGQDPAAGTHVELWPAAMDSRPELKLRWSVVFRFSVWDNSLRARESADESTSSKNFRVGMCQRRGA
jgi:hypothetical protein